MTSRDIMLLKILSICLFFQIVLGGETGSGKRSILLFYTGEKKKLNVLVWGNERLNMIKVMCDSG